METRTRGKQSFCAANPSSWSSAGARHAVRGRRPPRAHGRRHRRGERALEAARPLGQLEEINRRLAQTGTAFEAERGSLLLRRQEVERRLPDARQVLSKALAKGDGPKRVMRSAAGRPSSANWPASIRPWPIWPVKRSRSGEELLRRPRGAACAASGRQGPGASPRRG